MTYCFFFFNDTATTEIYTLSLHDALPISSRRTFLGGPGPSPRPMGNRGSLPPMIVGGPSDEGSSCVRGNKIECESLDRSEEHTSELQSLTNLVCRLLLEKKKKCRIMHLT